MQIVLSVFSIVLIVAVFLSRIRKDFWIYKILEYPRLQKLVITLLVSFGWFIFPPELLYQKIIAAGLVLSIVYLVYKIFPYTFFAKKEMQRVTSVDASNQLKVYTANVYQENHEYRNIIDQIYRYDPDIIFLLETNNAWAQAMEVLTDDYQYSLIAPLENTYGLLFYSRFPIADKKVNFLVKEDIPSISAVLELPSGNKLRLWGLHPEPPVPGESLYSTAKDKELMKVALSVRNCKMPAIVFGDLNDVAWSHTTELFRKTSRMLDPRRGRGYFNTFSAHSNFIRFPLDYIFCTKELSLYSLNALLSDPHILKESYI